jgi:hypothetical protein
MTFTEFLVKRRIDEAAFATGDAVRYAQWQTLYAQMHPNSFYNSVKMVLNDVRLRFHLAQVPAEAVAAPAKPRPVIRRAPSSTPAETPAEQAPVSKQPAEIVAQQSAPAPTEKPIAVETGEATAKPAKPRPVFKRPAPATAAGEDTPAPEKNSEPVPEIPAAAPRPRPVFKRPTAATSASEGPAGEKPVEPKVEGSTPESPKPPRSRPVFKRPSPEAETKPEETVTGEPFLASNPESSPKADADVSIEPAPVESKTATPRPRPVFKRPSAEVNVEGNMVEASPAKEPQTEVTQEGASVESTPAKKPPRPRPVFKRPPVASEPIKEEEKAATFSGQNPENRPKPEEAPGSKPSPDAIPQPKTPRPRPIFKRPSPPSEGDGNLK